jgi:hypothetical protein
MKLNVFTKDAGRILSSKEAQSLKDTYKERKLAAQLKEDEYIRSEFFGADQVMRLLSQPGCVGLRIHYAKRWEDKNGKPTEMGQGQLIPRVLLTGVNANGDDMPVYADIVGLKDMPADDGGGGAVGDGWTCPQHCRN